LVRKTNQDSGFVSTTMLLVADGMGGAAAGDVASAVAVRELRRLNNTSGTGEEILDTWREALESVNLDMANLIIANPRLDGMGTTICGGIFDGENLHIAHIGDSRGYLYSQGALTQFTHDHSYVQSLVDEGKIEASEAMIHPHRSLLLKVLNGQPSLQPDFFSVEVKAGDRVMFCSDGLCGLVTDEDIALGLAAEDPGVALHNLIGLAHDAGGTDNITIVIADVVEIKALPSSGDSPENLGDHTITFIADPDTLDQEILPVMEFKTSGLLGAACDPKIISRVKAAKKTGQKLNPKLALKPSAKESSKNSDASASSSTRELSPAEATSGETESFRYSLLSKKRRWIQLFITLLILGGLGAAAWGVRTYVFNQYYIGESGGKVAIYQGLPGDIAGIQTSWLYEDPTPQPSIKLTDLTFNSRDRVKSHIITTGGIDGARATVKQLEEESKKCQERRHSRLPDAPAPLDGC
jgi:protein phosphatase